MGEQMKPLLILSCSDVKRPLTGWHPFADIYDGPMWRQVRASGFPMMDVAAISALHGFMKPGQLIEVYDRVMDKRRSHDMCHTGDDAWRLCCEVKKRPRGAMIFGGELYRELARVAKRVWSDLEIDEATGSFLEQRKRLGEWLRAQIDGDDNDRDLFRDRDSDRADRDRMDRVR